MPRQGTTPPLLTAELPAYFTGQGLSQKPSERFSLSLGLISFATQPFPRALFLPNHFCGFFLGFGLLAAGASRGQAIAPGYVVTAGRDSLRGGVALHSDATQQRTVDFIPAQGNQRLQLDAAQLSAYGYVNRQDTVRYVALPLMVNGETGRTDRIFLRQLVAGPVEVYRYHYDRNYYSAPPTPVSRGVRATPNVAASNAAHPQLATPHYGTAPADLLRVSFPPLSAVSARSGIGVALLVHRRAQRDLTETSWWHYPTDAAAYFADCPALAADLRARRYHPRDLLLVVRRYNACATSPAPKP